MKDEEVQILLSQIVGILDEGQAVLPVTVVCGKHVISVTAYYEWKSQYSCVSVSELALVAVTRLADPECLAGTPTEYKCHVP
jgi:hypothetical protein